MVTALSLAVLTGVAGAATIYVQSQGARTSIQASLDAAVLAGTALRTGSSDAKRISVAKQAFEYNLQQAAKGSSAEIEITKDTEFQVNKTRVTGRAYTKVRNTLGAALGITDMQVDATATAKKMVSDPLCILALNKTQPSAIEVYGNAQFNARSCAVQANSDNGDGLKIYGAKSSATASQFGVTGNYSGENWSPNPVTGTEPVEDPYAGLPVPEPGTCVNTAGKLINNTFTLNPGTYCGGLNINANAVVTLNPGIYVIKDGQFSVNSGATVTGNDVLIALVGANAYLDLKSGTTVTLTSPQEGTYKNIQFMSDRDLSKSKFEQEWTTILSGAKLTFDGVMYLPEQQVWASGTGHDIIINANSPGLAIVADKIWAQGNVVFEITQEDRRSISEVVQAPSFGYGAMLTK